MNLPIQTPGKNPFTVPSDGLKKAIEAEFAGHEKYSAAKMPLTSLAFTAIDKIEEQKDSVIEALLVYIDTDTLSYRASSSESLKKEQDEKWGAVLTWAGSRFNAIWQTTSGLMPIEQPQALHENIRSYLQGLSSWQLSAFCIFSSIYSSLVLALAVVEKQLDAKKAFALSRMEEEAQAAQWGRDAEADARAQKMQEEIVNAERFLRLL